MADSIIEELISLFEAGYQLAHNTIFTNQYVNKNAQNFEKNAYISIRGLGESNQWRSRRAKWSKRVRSFEIDIWQASPPYQSSSSNYFNPEYRCEQMKEEIEDVMQDWGDGHGKAFTITSSVANDTITIDSNTLTTSAGALNINLAGSSYDTISELVTYIDGQSDYSATQYAPDSWPSTNLMEVTGADITSTYDIIFEKALVSGQEIRAIDFTESRPAHETARNPAVYRWIVKGNLQWYKSV